MVDILGTFNEVKEDNMPEQVVEMNQEQEVSQDLNDMFIEYIGRFVDEINQAVARMQQVMIGQEVKITSLETRIGTLEKIVSFLAKNNEEFQAYVSEMKKEIEPNGNQ